MTGTMTTSTARPAGRPAPPPASPAVSGTRRTLLALAASALGALPLKGLLVDNGWLIDVWLSMAVVIAPAAFLRRRRAPGALDVWPGIALLVPWLTARFVPDSAWGGFLPTSATRSELGRLMTDLHDTTANQVAPVHSTVAIRLVLCALLGLLAALIDLVAVVGRRGALAAVPLLAIYTVSGAVPRHPVSWVWFIAASAGVLVLFMLDAEDELQAWGRRISRRGAARHPLAVPVSAQRVGAVAIVAALAVPVLLPAQGRNLLTDFLHHAGGSGGGTGSGGISPFAKLKGQLNQSTAVDLFKVQVTGGHNPFYLRYDVLDTFTGKGWIEGSHGATRGVSDQRFDLDLPAPVRNTRSFQAKVNFLDFDAEAPVFARLVSITGLGSRAAWSTSDLIVVDAKVHRGSQVTETVDEPLPTAGELRAATTPLPFGVQQYLTLPSLPAKITALVDRLTKGKTTPYSRARAINDYFTDPASGFSYDVTTKDGDSGSDLVDFLTNRVGFCQQYAAAMAVLLRKVGVPSRVVLGYMHPAIDKNGSFTVTTVDAHAWVEAYFAGVGWVPFDPTPAVGLDGGPAGDLTYAPHSYPSGSAGSQARQTAPHLGSVPAGSAAPSGAAATATGRSSGWTAHDWVVLLIVLAVLVLALVPAGVRLLRRRRRLAAARSGDPDPLWAELSDTAVDLGYVWSPARTPRQVAAWLARDAGDGRSLDMLARAVERRRYSGPAAAVTEDDAAALRRSLVTTTAALRSSRSGRTRLRAWLWPASLHLGSQVRGVGHRRR